MTERAGGPIALAVACLSVGAAGLAIVALVGDENSTAIAATFAAAVAPLPSACCGSAAERRRSAGQVGWRYP